MTTPQKAFHVRGKGRHYEHPAASDSLGFTRPSWDGGDAA